MILTLKFPTGNMRTDENGIEVPEMQEKSFATPFISSRKLKNSFAVQKKMNNPNLDEETLLDEMADYIVDLYGKQFTRDELLDGISPKEILLTTNKCIQEIIGGLNEAAKELNPNV
jgi:hypothetical protein